MNQVVKFNPGSMLQPAHLAAIFGEESNVKSTFVAVPSLSPEGKVWTVSVNGEKTKITKTNDEGDIEPVSTMRVVVLDFAPRRGRTYYGGTYDPAKPAKPTCWSEDSIKPHATVEAKQHGTCDGCPMSIKSEGRLTPCQQHRMLAVVPSGDLTFTPLRLKLSITSVWDAKSPQLAAQGWYAWDNFKDYLIKRRGSPHTASFVTKLRFDPNVTYPKIMFAHERWLDDEELAITQPLSKSDEVKGLLAGTWTPAGVDGEKIDKVVEPVREVGAYTQHLMPGKPISSPSKPLPQKPALNPKQAAEPFIKPMLMAEDDDAPAAFVDGPVAARVEEAKVERVVAKMTKVAPVKTSIAAPAKAPAPAISNVVSKELEAALLEWGDD